MKHAIPPAVLEQHLAILGKTGRGKTNTAKDCVEQVYDQDFRVSILDTIKSDWWGLTSSSDGRRAGLPFHILGGPHAHVPLSSSSGRAIADLVARGQLRHTIIDMADFEPGGQMRWFVDFAPRLMQRMKGVLYLVIEEAHLLAPKERSGMGHENMSVHWAKMIAVAGRKKGIRLIVLSQRTQALHNAVIGSCDSMIVHGMTAPADMKPVIEWLKANSKDKERNATIESSLSTLRKGEGWVCNAETGLFERVQFPKARTYDNTATPEDDTELEEVQTAPVDIASLRAILGKAAEEAEASDPKILRKRIEELEAKLRKASHDAATTSKPDIDAAYAEGLARGQKDGQAVLQLAVYEQREKARNYLSEILGQVDLLRDNASRRYLEYNADRAPGNELLTPAAVTEYLQGKPRLAAKRAEVDYGGAPKPPRRLVEDVQRMLAEDAEAASPTPTGLKARILAALRWADYMKMNPTSRAALGALADFTPDKGYGARSLGELKSADLVEYPQPGFVALTALGWKMAPEPPQFGSMYEAWQAKLTGLHREVLMSLYAGGRSPMTRKDLGVHLGKQFDKGYSARVLGELKTMGVIEIPAPGLIRLTEHVIP